MAQALGLGGDVGSTVAPRTWANGMVSRRVKDQILSSPAGSTSSASVVRVTVLLMVGGFLQVGRAGAEVGARKEAAPQEQRGAVRAGLLRIREGMRDEGSDLPVAWCELQGGDQDQIEECLVGCCGGDGGGRQVSAQRGEEEPALAAERLVEAASVQAGDAQQVVDGRGS